MQLPLPPIHSTLTEESLIGFITFFSYYDINGNKANVEAIYLRILQAIAIYKPQLRLLLYLGIFKYYGDAGISEIHCRRILKEWYSSESKDLKRTLHDTTQRFIARSYSYNSTVVSLEVHSIHMAKYLMEQVVLFTSPSVQNVLKSAYF